MKLYVVNNDCYSNLARSVQMYHMDCKWHLEVDGVVLDSDQFRYDLAQRNGYVLSYSEDEQ